MLLKDCKSLSQNSVCYGREKKCKQCLKGNKPITQHAKDKAACFLYSECLSGDFHYIDVI